MPISTRLSAQSHHPSQSHHKEWTNEEIERELGEALELFNDDGIISQDRVTSPSYKQQPSESPSPLTTSSQPPYQPPPAATLQTEHSPQLSNQHGNANCHIFDSKHGAEHETTGTKLSTALTSKRTIPNASAHWSNTTKCHALQQRLQLSPDVQNTGKRQDFGGNHGAEHETPKIEKRTTQSIQSQQRAYASPQLDLTLVPATVQLRFALANVDVTAAWQAHINCAVLLQACARGNAERMRL